MSEDSGFELGLICKKCKTAAHLSCGDCEQEEVFFQENYDDRRAKVINNMGVLVDMFEQFSIEVEAKIDGVRISMMVFGEKISATEATEEEAISRVRSTVVTLLRKVSKQLSSKTFA